MTKLNRTFLKLLVGLGILVLVIQFVDVGETFRTLGKARPEWIAASVACFIATRILMALKWWILLGGRAASVSYPTVQRAICLSDYYALVFPNSLAVDTTRVVLLRHSRGGIGFVTAAILADRVINISTTAIASLLAIGITYALTGSLPFSELVLYSVLSISLLVLAACAVVVSRPAMLLAVECLRLVGRAFHIVKGVPKALAVIERIHGAMSIMLTRRKTLIPAMALACVVVLVRAGSVYFLFIAIGASQTFLLCLALVPTVTLITLLPLSLFGLGLKDGAFVLLFGGAGVATSDALGVSFASYAVIIGSSIILGLLATFIGPPLPTAQHPAAPTPKELTGNGDAPKERTP